MIKNHQYENLVWADLASPTDTEIKEVSAQHNISPLVAQDLLTPTPRPVVQILNNSFHAVFHFPVFKQSHSEGNSQEVDFVVGKEYVVTVRYDTVDALERLGKEIEVRAIVDKDLRHESAGVLLLFILKRMYESAYNELDYMNDVLSQIEKKIFSGKEKELVLALSQSIRNLLNFKKVMRSHPILLSHIEEGGKGMFGKTFEENIRLIAEEVLVLSEEIDNSLELAVSLRETTDGLLSTKQNEIMKTLTVMAFITLPLSFIASFFGMNTSLPIVGTPYDFLIVIGIMVLTSLFVFLTVKWRKWI
ncbi:MAG: magnesium transporter CorA family protein [Patescibacteria group bacterium]